MKIGQQVKVIGGNNEIGQPTMIGELGVVESFGTEYTVKGKKTKEVYVRFKVGWDLQGDNYETHVFNDYHLAEAPPLKT